MQVQDIAIEGPGRTLRGSLFTPDEIGQVAVMFLQGYKSNRKNYAEYAAALTDECNIVSLTVDLAGQGESEGNLRNLTARDHVKDAGAAYDALSRQPGVDRARMGVAGASYGGYLAVLLCRQRLPKSILLRAPSIHETLPAKTSEPLPSDSALRTLRDYEGGVTVVESELDAEIRPDSINACLAVAKHPKHIVIPGASHALQGEERQVFKNILLDWAREL